MRVKSEILGKEFGVYFRRLPAVLVSMTHLRGTSQVFAIAEQIPVSEADTRATRCDIKDMKTGEVVATGISYCDTRDQFEKSKGRRLAFTKAVHSMCMTPVTPLSFAICRQIRREFWKAYFSQMDKKLVHAVAE